MRHRDRRTVAREGRRMENMECHMALLGRTSMRDRGRAGVLTGRSMSTWRGDKEDEVKVEFERMGIYTH